MKTVVTSRALLEDAARRRGLTPERVGDRLILDVPDFRGLGPVTMESLLVTSEASC